MRTVAQRFALALALVVVGGAGAGVLSGCGSPPPESTPAVFPATAFLMVPSDHAQFSVALRSAPEQPPPRGVDEIEYVITDANGQPISGLELKVQPWMVEHGHGSGSPAVEETSPGHYVLHDVSLFMVGTWQLRSTVSGSVADTFTPEVTIE
jgi:hypothetical protein